jgi:hypothetical protein
MIISQGPRAILERSACVTYPLKIQPAVLPPFGVVTHRHNISDIAKKAGIERSSLYRAFAGSPTHPKFKTVLSVLDAMGFQLHVTARGGERATPVRLASSSKAKA